VTPGIVHLAIRAFCRAHMLEYVDNLLARDPGWGVIGASLNVQTPAMRSLHRIFSTR